MSNFKEWLLLLLFSFVVCETGAQVPAWEWTKPLHSDAEEFSQDGFVFNYDYNYLFDNADSYK
ncbi:MAG TPA: hypothetical protein VMV77_16715 [Bacteroidales bacterium]|nr:hypothetical protein [Bacteroidales bacterium]